jgi:hypothetical protein
MEEGWRKDVEKSGRRVRELERKYEELRRKGE